MTFPHLNGRAEKIAEEFKLNHIAAEWIAVAALHSGCFLRTQCPWYSREDTKSMTRCARGWSEQKLVLETLVAGLGLLCRITNKKIYRTLGVTDSRHRRKAGKKFMFRRLLSLDYVLDNPELRWRPTESEKLAFFENLGIVRTDLPFRVYRGADNVGYTKRYFANKHPIAVDAGGKRAVFVYADSEELSPQGLSSWRKEHTPLWTALYQRGFRLDIVHASRNPNLSASVERLFKTWAQSPARSEDRPKLTRELRLLQQALDSTDGSVLDHYGGFTPALRRAAELERRLENISKPAGYEASYKVWLSKRIPSKGDKRNRLGPRHGDAQSGGDDNS